MSNTISSWVGTYHASDLSVIQGVNFGHVLSHASTPFLGDIYKFSDYAAPCQTAVGPNAGRINAVCTLHMMSECGQHAHLLLLSQGKKEHPSFNSWVMSQTKMIPGEVYTLIDMDRMGADALLGILLAQRDATAADHPVARQTTPHS